MNGTTPKTSDLSSGQVRSLLALGLTTPTSQNSHAEFETLKAFLEMRDKSVLRLAISDLQAPIASAAVGPLSLQKLTGVDSNDLEKLRGKTFLDVLSMPKTSIPLLKALERYGAILDNPIFPETTRLLGALGSTWQRTLA